MKPNPLPPPPLPKVYSMAIVLYCDMLATPTVSYHVI